MTRKTTIPILLLSFLFSCKKYNIESYDHLPANWKFKFFSIPSNANPILHRISNKIRQIDATSNFLEKFVKKNGFIIWDKAKIKVQKNTLVPNTNNESNLSLPSDTIILLPLVEFNDTKVNSFLSTKINEGLFEFKLYEGEKYAEYGFNLDENRVLPNANDVVKLIFEFEKEIFGWNFYKVFDERLFKRNITISGSPSSTFVKMTTVDSYVTNNGESEDCIVYTVLITNDGGVTWTEIDSWESEGCEAGGISFIGGGGGSSNDGNGIGWGYGTDPFWGYGGSGSGYSGPPDPGGTEECIPWMRFVQNNGNNNYNATQPPCFIQPIDYYPIYRDYALPPFIWVYSGDDGSLINDLYPNIEPAFTFDPIDNYENLYPRFTSLVRNLKTFVKENPKVLAALQKYSGFSKDQIIEKLTFGNGPKIKVKEMGGRFGYFNKSIDANTLFIRASYVRGLEQTFLESTKEATAFLLAVTILHEFVHFGTAQNNISEGVYDFGTGFERDAFNVIVTDDNSGSVVIKFSSYF